tara:strand:+ start:16920 stop:17855 length:936 start_codon:yes stop_codon:yes gene_type:complete
MALRGANQHLTAFVSTAAAPVGVGTVATPAAGEITYQATTGKTYATPALAAAESLANGSKKSEFSIMYHALNGEIYRRGPFLTADIVEESTKAYAAPVEQIDTFTVPATVIAGDQYILKLAVPNYGGLISQQDEIYFYGNYVAQTGDTAALVAVGLHASLKKRLDSLPVAIATATVATSIITVTGVAQPYVKAKWEGKQVNFRLTLAAPSSIMNDRTSSNAGVGTVGTVLSPAKTVGFGTYAQVAAMEEFYAGYDSDYLNREADFPANGDPQFAAAVGGTYNSRNIVLRVKNYSGAEAGTQRQTIACYFAQ